MDEWCVEFLRDHLDHPWIAERREELAPVVGRLEAVIDTNNGRPRIVYWRDLTELGKGFDLQPSQ